MHYLRKIFNQRKIFRAVVVAATWLTTMSLSFSQNNSKVLLGSAEDLRSKLFVSGKTSQSSEGLFTLTTGSDQSLTVKINNKASSHENSSIGGTIVNHSNATATINFFHGKVNGNVVLRDEKKAYNIFSDEAQNVYIEETDIHDVLCIEYAAKQKSSGKKSQKTSSDAPIPSLQSLPGAPAVLYLDMDGEYVVSSSWNGGSPIDALSPEFANDYIQEVWGYVSEDFRPFNINVTTDLSVFNSVPRGSRMRCIITPTSEWFGWYGGVAYIGSFQVPNDDVPCWVFSNNLGSAKNVAEATSHEFGHTLGLGHDGLYYPDGTFIEYYGGQGDWAPIMGVGYSGSVVQWSKGEYQYASNNETDLEIIAGPYNGFGFRTDDHGNTVQQATPLSIGNGSIIDGTINTGVIHEQNDKDFFSFTTNGGTVELNVTPTGISPNINILAELYNQSGQLIASNNRADGLWANITTTLAAGTYYLAVDGVGDNDPFTNGYSGYASLGSYAVSGTLAGNSFPVVSILTPANNSTFQAPATFTFVAFAKDYDGSISKVQFYLNSSLVGEKFPGPYDSYSININNLTAGTYVLTAVAYDNQNYSTTSQPVTIVVEGQSGGVCTGTAANGDYSYEVQSESSTSTLTFIPEAPIAGSTMVIFYYRVNNGGYAGHYMTQSGANFTKQIQVNEGSVVDFYFTYRVGNTGAERNSSANPHQFTAGNCGQENQAPVVSIISPTDESEHYAPASFNFEVSAFDPDGTIEKVVFYINSQAIGEDATSPYVMPLEGFQEGLYNFTASAYDNQGVSTSTEIIQVYVIAPPSVCTGSAANGDYIYEVSSPGNTSVIRFIPQAPIAGSTMCILYYQINYGGYAGHYMNPYTGEFSKTISVNEGAIVDFYFTYRVGNTNVERNSSATPHHFTAGQCGSSSLPVAAISVYPSHANESIVVEGTEFENEEYTITIVSPSGMEMLKKTVTVTDSNLKDLINVSSFPTGLYFIKVYSEGINRTEKFIKH